MKNKSQKQIVTLEFLLAQPCSSSRWTSRSALGPFSRAEPQRGRWPSRGLPRVLGWCLLWCPPTRYGLCAQKVSISAAPAIEVKGQLPWGAFWEREFAIAGMMLSEMLLSCLTPPPPTPIPTSLPSKLLLLDFAGHSGQIQLLHHSRRHCHHHSPGGEGFGGQHQGRHSCTPATDGCKYHVRAEANATAEARAASGHRAAWWVTGASDVVSSVVTN